MSSKYKDYHRLKQFSLDHYNYINQLLGDITLREVIMENFTSPENWTLITEEREICNEKH